MANLTGSRSNFPNQIDEISELYDLPINKRTQAQRYQELKTKTTLTPAGVSELNALTTELQAFIVTPETWNKFGDVVISTQKFFSENVFGFVENKQTEMNSYVDLKKTEMQTEIDKFNDRGTYSPSVQYFKNNFVTFNDGTSNQTYLCLQDCINKEPSSTPLFWRKLTIQGAKGDTGSSGANFVFKGSWNNTTTFMKDEAVRFGGMLFVSKIDNNLDNSPSLTADTDYWFRAMDITITVRKMVGTRNVASQTSTVNFITGEISSFNPTVDSLDVYMNSVRLTRGFDYNINPNNQAIDKINGTWNGSIETPVFFEFVVTKNIINNLIFKDGSALSDGTVTRNKLDVDTQAEINKIDGIDYDLGTFESVIDRYIPLETTAQTVIPAINEINTGLSETNTQLAQKPSIEDVEQVIDESLGGAKIRDNNGVLETLVGLEWIPILKEGDVMPILTNVISVHRNFSASESQFTTILNIQSKKGILKSCLSTISLDQASKLKFLITVDGNPLQLRNGTGALETEFNFESLIENNGFILNYGGVSTVNNRVDRRGIESLDINFKDSLVVSVRNISTVSGTIKFLAQTE